MDLPTQVYSCGFNAHGQLGPVGHSLDVLEYSQMQEQDTQILFAGWSESVLFCQQPHLKLFRHGTVPGWNSIDSVDFKHLNAVTCGFGDHNGLLGVVSTSPSGLWTTTPNRESLVSHGANGDEDSPRLKYVAIAGNGKTAVTFVQAPSAMLTHISEFSSFDDFVQWYDRPADSYPTAHYMLHGRAKQLIANETSFTLLTETGEVYTWGDARHHSLGRTPTTHMPAEKPGVVDALGGLKIGKIVSGGWMGAALAEGGSLYLWGTTTPGTADTINALPSGDEEVALVDIPASLGMHGEEADDFEVLDVGVGDGHIVAVGSFPTPPRPPHDPAGDNPSAYSFETSSETPSATALASPALHVSRTHIYAIGDGRNGQLGLGVPSYAENWKQAPVPWSWREHKAVGVACGPRTSFAFIRPTLNKKRKRTI